MATARMEWVWTVGAGAPPSEKKSLREELAKMVRLGFLTEADAFEIEGLVLLLVDRAQAGEITDHFVQVVLRKLAEEKYRDYLQRRRRVGQQG